MWVMSASKPSNPSHGMAFGIVVWKEVYFWEGAYSTFPSYIHKPEVRRICFGVGGVCINQNQGGLGNRALRRRQMGTS